MSTLRLLLLLPMLPSLNPSRSIFQCSLCSDVEVENSDHQIHPLAKVIHSREKDGEYGRKFIEPKHT
jgi:hypothetical protein